MTLDEAIKHCLEVAEQNEKKAEYRPRMDSYDEIESRTDCLECAADHRQLAEWLTELKEAKRLLKSAVEDIRHCMHYYDPCEVCSLLDKDGECPVTDDDDCKEKYKWLYEDEALALIGEDTNVPATADDIIVGSRLDGWISCEDRLPIEQGPVLCYTRSTTGEGNYRILGTLRNGEFWFLQVDGTQLSFPNLCLEVTHWMPLPEPPKEE